MPAPAPHTVRAVRLPDNEQVTIRSARPDDAGRVQAYVRGLSPAARYDRFLGPVNELSPAELDRVIHIDHLGLTLIAQACVAGSRVVIGEARYAAAPDGLSCEIAVSVADAWRGKGLDTRMLENLECRARSFGVRTLVGDVLRSNAPMKRLARKAGFHMTGPPADARLVRIVKDISRPQAGLPCGELTASGLSIAA
jgi:acetyltransferase